VVVSGVGMAGTRAVGGVYAAEEIQGAGCSGGGYAYACHVFNLWIKPEESP
jgi:hypothetical protein